MTTARPDIDANRPSRRTARTPVRERGIQRQAMLLDAVDHLLTLAEPEDVGIYQIAEQAGVAPASVYHFFPTKEAAFVALAQRYLMDFQALGTHPIEATRLQSWQGYFEVEQERMSACFNCHRPALKIFLGCVAPSVRDFGSRFSAQMTAKVFELLNQLFHMPHLENPGHRFRIAHAITEAVWTQGYIQHGVITEDDRRDALEAHHAYCRLFLPENVEPRDWLKTAAAQGASIILEPAPEAIELSKP